MQKAYNIQNVNFVDNCIIIVFDNQTVSFPLVQVSDKLVRATERERLNYTISPSGYGIHWPLLDEDLSINGLLK
ncbi:MAG: DUF2442 domain-containing protein [Bacteroidales bacterium]|nr:MAG: DUF2442 domain-containing protein [Bacteroidales bacterium]